ncbi:hypothetical protein ACFQ1E_06670 [Sphingomonas canadensis]|uniref:DUF1361 domain-containing protein n=1 Tax=Sphingomonas canadensis TaxID=1219257 RepID=A0ABW3H9M5_9SPHN|nr:hypothetical protein [Sphingomonas canadensis]MCW3835529.1 hypothetical protein [Sphingomonas canadensis]
MSHEPTDPAGTVHDPRERWYSPYGGIEFGLSLRWLLAGTLLYAVLLLVAMAGRPDIATYPLIGPSLYLTPVFGLPFVLGTLNRPGRTRRIGYFLVLLPLAHVAANYAAWYYASSSFDLANPGLDPQRDRIAGAIGGTTGAALSLGLLRLVQLTTPGRRHLVAILIGIAALGALGAEAMARGLQWTDALRRLDDPGRAILWYEAVHLPWQALFALWLAWLMRRPREPRPPRPALDG